MSKTEYGIQMYSIRDITADSLEKALGRVAEMGYKYIEFAGFFDNSAEDVKKWLDKFGLICSGTHTGIDQLSADNIDKVIEYHKIIGCDNLIVPGCDWSTKEKCDNVIETMNFAINKLKENGIRFGYHNHSREFFPTKDGIVFEDEVILRTDAELEIDTFWAFNACIDVLEYLNKYKDRISVIHLKDGIVSSSENKNFNHVHDGVEGLSLGQGDAPVKLIREWAIKNNVLMVVESEGLDPTGPDEVLRCMEYLRTLDLSQKN